MSKRTPSTEAAPAFPPASGPASSTRTRARAASAIAAERPPKPAPMTATSAGMAHLRSAPGERSLLALYSRPAHFTRPSSTQRMELMPRSPTIASGCASSRASCAAWASATRRDHRAGAERAWSEQLRRAERAEGEPHERHQERAQVEARDERERRRVASDPFVEVLGEALPDAARAFVHPAAREGEAIREHDALPCALQVPAEGHVVDDVGADGLEAARGRVGVRADTEHRPFAARKRGSCVRQISSKGSQAV